jgi:hypothetical protein
MVTQGVIKAREIQFWVGILDDTPLSSLMHSTVSPKMKTTKGKGVGACFLACSTSRVEGCAKAQGWGLGRLTSNSITHTDLHKPNNELVHSWGALVHGQTMGKHGLTRLTMA